MTKFKVTKVKNEDGEIIESTYTYRDIEFERHDRIASGYFGRYEIKGYRKVISMSKLHSTLASVKQAIDKYYEAKGDVA